ncbi:hypothetical protein [Desulfogranum marinum]|uniref:hypothetical protein n=1 Tax=Desulfogranum marinum TaxID=453220 RepID=UPI0029C7E4C7|nr:hypothetical protein [Desulfogranum marinum]
MKKIHEDKTRATFYIDSRMYKLLKRCSAIEGIPMSSIINDEILENRVGKYQYSSPEEAEYQKCGAERDAQENEQEEYYEAYSKTPEGQFESAKYFIEKQLKENSILPEEAERLIEKASRKYEEQIEQERIREEKEKENLKKKWEKAIKKYPL